MKRAILLIVILTLLSIGCGSSGSEYVFPTSTPRLVATRSAPTPVPTFTLRAADTSAPTYPLKTATTSSPTYPACSQASAGSSTTCRIDHAYCSYQPNVSGNPTFCNDAPYPNNDFTFLVWGQDWSDLDGRCLIVTGTVSLYKGMPQIEAQSRSQVMEYCD